MDDPEETREEKREAAREEVIEAIERSTSIYGVKRSYGRLYGILFFAHDPLSLDELVEESGYAKSTVSDAMSTLQRFHMVNRRSKPGEGKRAFFEAETDLWHVVQEFLQTEIRRETQIMSRALADAEEQLEAAGADEDLEKVRRLRRLYDQTDMLISVLGRVPLDRFMNLVKQLKRE
ncbi:GbsR/MarR family transcriptional regulator [Haladaptatus sp. CMAA 1911]|uniref:GbsR/MarR family transcriptional regulator n=1 Tax=unclassified Haladaptatus TaxID=2622732 RepID=UPI00375468EF